MNKDLQKQLVGTIFSLNNISKFRYEQIQYESHLSKLFKGLDMQDDEFNFLINNIENIYYHHFLN